MIFLTRSIMDKIAGSPAGMTAGMVERALLGIFKNEQSVKVIISRLKGDGFLSAEKGNCCECGKKTTRYKIAKTAGDWKNKMRKNDE